MAAVWDKGQKWGQGEAIPRTADNRAPTRNYRTHWYMQVDSETDVSRQTSSGPQKCVLTDLEPRIIPTFSKRCFTTGNLLQRD